MLQIIISSLNTWHASKNERQKLQQAYLGVAALVVLTAGITSLFDASLGHNMSRVALICVVIFLTNAVAWNLLQSSLLDKLSSKPKHK